jgi:hypothetical protein
MISLLLSVVAADPTIFYSKSFPGSSPAYVEITVARDGTAVYKEKPDDDQPVKLKLKAEEAEAIFGLAEKLDRFKNKLESGLPVAKMGEKTFRWVEDKPLHEQKFNYSTEESCRELQEWFEKIVETEMHLFALERTARFDKLGVNKALLQLEASWDKKRLVALEQFYPWLNRIIKGDSYLNMARERAEKLLATFQAPPPAPAK